MDGQQRHHGVDGPVAQRQAFRVGRTPGAATGGRWSGMIRLGSTARTVCGGSYEPVPAPASRTSVTSSPSAAWIRAAIRGSGRRVRA
ncbi:hypothetical protein [Streptomyces sp. DG1A-41]|uniref:hypothetical protein n=1 Tax=Streptomyces sp. DG1A-41 TaxID=3125779 RepID=UPI0030D2E423